MLKTGTGNGSPPKSAIALRRDSLMGVQNLR